MFAFSHKFVNIQQQCLIPNPISSQIRSDDLLDLTVNFTTCLILNAKPNKNHVSCLRARHIKTLSSFSEQNYCIFIRKSYC